MSDEEQPETRRPHVLFGEAVLEEKLKEEKDLPESSTPERPSGNANNGRLLRDIKKRLETAIRKGNETDAIDILKLMEKGFGIKAYYGSTYPSGKTPLEQAKAHRQYRLADTISAMGNAAWQDHEGWRERVLRQELAEINAGPASPAR